MKNLTLNNITDACHGTYHGDPALLSEEISAVTTDSRTVSEGALFIAIVGERSDGHRFITGTYEKGALCCISEKELPDNPYPYIQVASSLQALKDLAAFYRKSLDIKVIGITGSVGKTSTKEMIASVLSQKYCVLKTPGNFNNAVGLPLTIFQLREEHQIAVLEMGISEFGEMRVLTNIAHPDAVVMTNIGQCHLETLGSRDGILKAKSEIFECLSSDGMVFLNGDDDKLSSIEQVNGIIPCFFGLNPALNAYAEEVKNLGLDGTLCRIHLGNEQFDAMISIPGHHMLYNAIAGACIGKAFGLTNEEIKTGIESLQPVSGRNHIVEHNGLTIIDDCYNANPASMKASIDVVSTAKGRRVCILGDMFELGQNEKALHRETGAYLSQKPVDLLITAGALAKELADAAKECSEKKKDRSQSMFIYTYTAVDALIKDLPQLLRPGDTVLVKASHGMHFERIVQFLTEA